MVTIMLDILIKSCKDFSAYPSVLHRTDTDENFEQTDPCFYLTERKYHYF